MTTKLLTLMLAMMMYSTAGAQTSVCEEKPSFWENLIATVTFKNRCSKIMRQAIGYREDDKKSAKETFKHLCRLENGYTPSCLIMGKDASIKDQTLAYVCQTANDWTPLCLVTASSKLKSDNEIMSLCSEASEEKIKNIK